MPNLNRSALTLVGAIAAGILVIVLLVLMVSGSYTFFPALFLAVLISLLSSIIIYLSFGEVLASIELPGKVAPSATAKAEAKPVAATAAESATSTKTAAAKPAAASAPAKAKPAKAKAAKEKAKETKAKPASAAPAAGSKPKVLDGPDGKADDLKMIKGVGPKLEKVLHSMGFYHFSQIAEWGPSEVAWVDENLTGFKGRVSRDDWVDQAKTLASGGDTAFSKKVEGGDVY
jgi:predicted flap endonuclease-1-like 5' DNA nuclease